MNAVPAAQRGAASGMRGTFFNSGSALSIGMFFSLMVIGLASTLPNALTAGLVAQGVTGRRRPADRQPAAGRQPVRRVPRLQPDRALLGPSGVLHDAAGRQPSRR